MRVKLTQDIIQNGIVKTSRRAVGTRLIEGQLVELVRKVEFVEGATIDMSDASGQKYVDAGWAEPA